MHSATRHTVLPNPMLVVRHAYERPPLIGHADPWEWGEARGPTRSVWFPPLAQSEHAEMRTQDVGHTTARKHTFRKPANSLWM